MSPHDPKSPTHTPPNTFDPFALNDGAYSVHEFYLHATEGGFSAKTPRASVPPSIAAQMNELVQSHSFPYRTMEAVIRDSVFHRLHFLAEEWRVPGLHRDLNMWAQQEKVAAAKSRLVDNARYLDDLSEACDMAQRASNYPLLADMIDGAAEAAEHEDEPQRKAIVAVVKRYVDDVKRWRRGLEDVER